MTANKLYEAVNAGDPKAIERVIRAVRAAKGDLSVAAKKLLISRRTLDRWGKECDGLKEALAPLRIKPGPRKRVA